MRFLLVTLALVSSAAVAAPQCQIPGLPKITGKSYHVARGMLIDAGMTPASVAANFGASDRVKNARISLGYIELFDCASSGTSPCVFRWSDTRGQPFTAYANGCEAIASRACRFDGVECGHD